MSGNNSRNNARNDSGNNNGVENAFETNNPNNNGTNNATTNVVGEEYLPQILYFRGGSHVINVPRLYVKDSTSWKDRALFENQKRFYKRSWRVGAARKPMDKSNETCFPHVYEESSSSEDEGITTVKEFMAIADDEPVVGKTDVKSDGCPNAKEMWIAIERLQQEDSINIKDGYRKEEGIDYDETFTPVARLKAIRIFLAYATYNGFMVYQMDVKSAFINGKLTKEVYVQQPLGFESIEFLNYVCKLDEALYGLKQASIA
ncbi:retrovirus-related pol polyprotein from transposon TNT 1-94 [Tanacetum coccineum]